MPEKIKNTILLSLFILVIGVLPAVLYRISFGGVPSLTPGAAKRMLVADPQGTRLVDVRTPQEFAEGHVKGAEAWPLDAILRLASKDGVPERLRGRSLLLICRAGVRSVKGARHLSALGVAGVYNVRDGMVAWIGDADNPEGREFNALELADGRSTALPEKPTTLIEQAALVVSSYGFKPLYVLASLATAFFIWRRRTRSSDLRILATGLVFFSLGEIFCSANYNLFHGHSYFFDYLHSFGMIVAFSFITFALFEGLDGRLIRFSRPQDRCLFLPLCRQCYKSGEIACRLFRTFLFLSAAGAALTLIPLTARPVPVSYNTRIFGTFFNFSNTVPFQLFEIRYCPWAAAVLFLSAGLVLLFHQRRPSVLSKVLFSGAAGLLGFSFFRLFLYAPYTDNVVWQFFWEEATELIFIAGVVVVLWLFRKGLFPKAEIPPA